MFSPDESMHSLIAKLLNEAGAEPNSDIYVSTQELWNSLTSSNSYAVLDQQEKDKLRRRFLTALHSSRSSLAFFESKQDPFTKEISWKLRTTIQDISLFTMSLDDNASTPSEKNNKRIDELQKEVRRLRSEIHQLEIKNGQ